MLSAFVSEITFGYGQEKASDAEINKRLDSSENEIKRLKFIFICVRASDSHTLNFIDISKKIKQKMIQEFISNSP